jgi:hypothetical protein
LGLLLSACSGASGSPAKHGSATVSLNGATYKVGDVVIVMQPGEDGWFRIEGDALPKSDEDCVPGLAAGISLYGELPTSVHKPLDLVGKRLQVDFSGDGDDANFCFAGMGGLAGAESAWVTFDSVSGDRVTFSMEGSFKIYDENGEGPVATASGRGTAQAKTVRHRGGRLLGGGTRDRTVSCPGSSPSRSSQARTSSPTRNPPPPSS